MASPGPSSAMPSDLDRLEAIFFKIALAEDSQLQSVVDQYLVKILSFLSSSPSDSVKQKVVEILSHVNKRLQANQQIKLPLAELFQLLEDRSSSLLLLNFAKVYVRMGFKRASSDQCIDLLPRILKNPALSPQSDLNLFVFLLCSCLRQIGPDKSTLEKCNLDNIEVSLAINRVLLVVLLYPYGQGNSSYPCLSQMETKAIQESGLIDDLETLKYAAINLINLYLGSKNNETKVAELFCCHYLVAASDSTGRVANYAEVQLRHLNNSIDWSTSVSAFESLLQLYMGSGQQRPQTATAGSFSQQQTAVMISPADLRLRLKILPIVLKFSSKLTCEFRTKCIPLVFDTLFSANSNSKLKLLALQFVHTWLDSWLWEKLTPLAPILSTAFVQVIKQSDDESVKPLGYSAVGKLFSRFPSLIEANFDIVMNMFKLIQNEQAHDMLSPYGEDIELALNALAPAICQQIQLVNREKIFVEVSILCSVKSKRAARVALRYLRLFPTDHLASRWLIVQLSARADPDFRQECFKALFEIYLPKEEQPDSLVLGVANPLRPEIVHPRFLELLAYFHEQFNAGKYNSEFALSYGNNTLPFAGKICAQVVLFLRTVLCISEASAPPTDILVATLQFQELQRTSPCLTRYFSVVPNEKLGLIFDLYSSLLIDILRCQTEPIVLFLLTELIRTVPQTLLSSKANYVKGILPICQAFTSSTGSFETVELYCELFGAIKSTTEENCDQSMIAKFERHPVGLLALAHTALFSTRSGKLQSSISSTYFESEFVDILSSNPDATDRLIALKAISISALIYPVWKCEKLLEKIAESWTKALSVKESRTRPYSIQALGRLGCSMLPSEETAVSKQKLVEKLLGITPDEDIYVWIGQALVDLIIGPISSSNADLWRIEPSNYDSQTTDYLLTSKLGGGDFNTVISSCSSDFVTLVDRLLSVQLRNGSKFVRECGLVSLFIVLKSAFPSIPEVVRSKFPAINQSLFPLLTEDNAHIQQTICELLSFMYEAMPSEDRDKQLEPLIDVLMGRKTINVTVAENTELFKEGQLGETAEGQKLSTYKELCSLASDLNQPDLIYRFMELANDQCSWLTKSGAAAGLGSIFSKTAGKAPGQKSISGQANARLAGSLLSGIGKLYRYQFDPDSNVRSTMLSLWQVVVSSSGQGNLRDLINANLEAIFSEIDQTLSSRLWRVRESSVGALSDSLRVLVDPHDKRLLKRLPSFWNAILHLLDDIKESVRVAAAKSARSLQKVTVRLAQSRTNTNEPAEDSSLNEVSSCLGQVIDILFKQGVESKAEEVRAVSLATLMLLVDSSGQSLLASHCVSLIPAFLESSSSLEPQVLSYVSVRANDETELAMLESVRVRVAGMSPIAQSVEQCLDIVPLESLPDLFIRLADLLKPSAGLLTRSATCQAITQLVLRRFRGGKIQLSLLNIDQSLNRLFNALLSACSDRSEAVRKAASTTLAHLSSLKPEVFVRKIATKACEWYLKGSLQLEDDSDPLLAKAASNLLQSLTLHCPLDLLQNEPTQQLIVPCLFFALHEKNVTQDEATSNFKLVSSPSPDLWDEIWNELAQGTESTLRRNLDELCELVVKCSQVQRYGLRLQTAVTIEALASKVDQSMTQAHASSLARCLLALLQGRTWPSKEVILEIVIKFVEKVNAKIPTEIYAEIISSLVRESRKAQLEYSVVAFKALCVVVDFSVNATSDNKHSNDLFDNYDDFLARCVLSFISPQQDQSAMEVDVPAFSSSSTSLKKLAVVAEFIDVSNKSVVLMEKHLPAIEKEAFSNALRLFCLAMHHTTTSNSTKQLAARLLAGFDLALSKLFKAPVCSSIANDAEMLNMFKQSVLECIRLSAKLTDARNADLVLRFFSCLRHFFEAKTSLSNEFFSSTSEDVEVRQEIAELCRYMRSKAATKCNDDVTFIENFLR